MVSTTLKRRRTVEQMRGKPPKRVKKFKKQREYHSSSEEEESEDDQEEFQPVNLGDSEEEEGISPQPKPEKSKKIAKAKPTADDKKEASSDAESSNDEEGGSDSDSLSETSTNAATAKKRKRNDPEAFATSISKILGSKLSTSKRADPVLARSKDAATANKELSEGKLELKAKHKLKEEKRAALEKGRVKDVLGLETPDTSTQEILEQEKRLKKTAQRGVIKLFNAVRAAQVKGEEAAREAKKSGVIGLSKREEKVTEMSKKGFLDFIAGGGKKPEQATKA